MNSEALDAALKKRIEAIELERQEGEQVDAQGPGGRRARRPRGKRWKTISSRASASGTSTSTVDSEAANFRVWLHYATHNGLLSIIRDRIVIAGPNTDVKTSVILTALAQTCPALITEQLSQNLQLKSQREGITCADLMALCLQCIVTRDKDGSPTIATVPIMGSPTPTVDELIHFTTASRGINMFPLRTGLFFVDFEEPDIAKRALRFEGKVIRYPFGDCHPMDYPIISPTCFICEPPNGTPFAYFPRGKMWMVTVCNDGKLKIDFARRPRATDLAHTTAIMYTHVLHAGRLAAMSAHPPSSPGPQTAAAVTGADRKVLHPPRYFTDEANVNPSTAHLPYSQRPQLNGIAVPVPVRGPFPPEREMTNSSEIVAELNLLRADVRTLSAENVALKETITGLVAEASWTSVR